MALTSGRPWDIHRCMVDKKHIANTTYQLLHLMEEMVSGQWHIVFILPILDTELPTQFNIEPKIFTLG